MKIRTVLGIRENRQAVHFKLSQKNTVLQDVQKLPVVASANL